ncbi:hypothetical protein MKX01_024974 [Papaver californicum]|nr:hypothetical protein MKX01_024974 [Papaver californicum]
MERSTTTTHTTSTITTTKTPPPKTSTNRRYNGVRKRPSGRWVAEIKDSSQHVRLWLGTTNFAAPLPILDADGGLLSADNSYNSGLNYSSLRAKLNKNIQTFASIFNFRSPQYHVANIDTKNTSIGKSVQPSIIVPQSIHSIAVDGHNNEKAPYSINNCVRLEVIVRSPPNMTSVRPMDSPEAGPSLLGTDEDSLPCYARSKRLKVPSSVMA